jgi:FMN-dependent oxidoreductase (nitrilotriacetate monooxygenase family)
MFHMGWFVGYGFGVQSWNQVWSGAGGTEWSKPDLYIDLARSMERSGFDYLMIEDSSCIPDTHGGSMESVLRNAHGAPKHDPMPLVALLAAATSRLGLVCTAATSFYPPYLLARLISTLDHFSNGRVGVNLVTASSHRAAQNYGLDRHIEHDLRYRIADEWTEVVTKLWDSWEPGAVVLDEDAGIFADHTKVHTIDHQGEYFTVRGPLQTILSPQGRPVICQAGGSPAGKDFAVKWADTIVSGVRGVDGMKDFRNDITERLAVVGRDPRSCKVLYLIMPVLGETEEEAQEKHRRILAQRHADPHFVLQTMSYASGIDFSKFDLDEPLPEFETNGHQSTLADFARSAQGKTLRELASYRTLESIELVGTPDSVAAMMGEAMEEAGGDGFLIGNALERRQIAEITDGLMPALQKRGLTRRAYTHERLRDNLLEF